MKGKNSMTSRGRTSARDLTRRGFLAAAAGGAAAFAAGCASDKFVQVPGAGVPAAYAKRQHIVLWHSYGGNLLAALQHLIDEFHKAQNDIYVEAQFQGSYEATQQKLAAGIISKQIPDIVSLSEITWRKMHLADTLEPLNDYFGGDFTPDRYVDQFIQEGTVKGKIWWVPFARSTPLFYYNADVFEKAGHSEAPVSWKDYHDWAPDILKVRTKKGTPKGIALGSTYASWYFQSNMWAWGGNWSRGLDVTCDEPNALAAAHYLIDELVRKQGSAYLSATGDVDFGNQTAAAFIGSTGSLANITELAKAGGFRVGTCFLLEYDHFGCPTGGSGLGIMRGASASRKQAAFEFVKFLGRPENSAYWTIKTGYLPIVKDAQKNSDLVALTKKDPNFQTSLQQLPKTKPQDLIRPVVANAGILMDAAMTKLYSTDLSVDDVFARLSRQLQSRADLIRESYDKHYT